MSRSKRICMAIFLLSAFIFTACGSKGTQNTINEMNNDSISTEGTANSLGNEALNNATEDLTGVSTSPTVSGVPEYNQLTQVFRKGTWFAVKGEVSVGYFSFEPEKGIGTVYNLIDGSQTAFEYEEVDNIVTLTSEGEIIYSGRMEQLDDVTIIITPADNELLTMTYVSDKVSGDFVFYTTTELLKMAETYYEKVNGYMPIKVAYMDIPDSTVTIQLYKEEGNDVVVDVTYNVNRLTAMGVEGALAAEVDLKQ